MRTIRRRHVYRAVSQAGLHYVFRYANNVAQAVDACSPEAGALSSWLDQTAASLGLPAGRDYADVPVQNGGVSAPSWRRLRAALARGFKSSEPASGSAAELWLDSLSAALGFDADERAVLALALFYRHDERIMRLVDRISMARGCPSRLRCDFALLGLLLACDPGALVILLKPIARLRSSGVLLVDRDGDMDALSQLLALVQSSTAPGDDPFAQLLGPTVAPTLPWAAFDHLGPEAGVAETVLRTAVASREVGGEHPAVWPARDR